MGLPLPTSTSPPPSGRPYLDGRLVDATQHRQVVTEMSCNQEMLADIFVTDPAHPLPLVGIAKQIPDPISGALGRVHEKTGVIIVHLQGDPATSAPDHGLAFPQSLGHCQSKAFLDRLLQHDEGGALQ